MIAVERLAKRFGDVEAVREVSFRAGDGRVTGLLGPNGAGKTTTLRMISTLLVPSAGTVAVDGLDASRDPLGVRARIGALSDARGLYARLTARENIAYYGELRGMPRGRIDEAIERLAAMLELEPLLGRRTDGFSQGERMKVAIARALVHDPPNVILDEPTNGLDVMTTRAMRGYLQRLRAEGRCVLFSSHIMQEVAALCDHIVVIAKGHVVAQGSADELRERTGLPNLEDAFVKIIGSDEGLFA
jgi:sodium transport system ATP-binding protein